MRLNINIDFKETYPIYNVADDWSRFQFDSIDVNGDIVVLHVNIDDDCNPFLPDVFNLAFGPLDDRGEVDDTAVIKHRDNSRVYSTVLLGAITFLDFHHDRFVGVDGSNLVRACLYYKLFQLNREYLSGYINSFGIKYYVRLLRGKEKGDPLFVDDKDLATSPLRIPGDLSIQWDKMFNYFIFCLSG